MKLRFCDYIALFVIISMFVVSFPTISTIGILGWIMSEIIILGMTIPICAWLCGWKRRYHSHQERERLLTLRPHTATGKFSYVNSHVRKVEYHSNPVGTSIGNDGTCYTHYGPDTRTPIYDYYTADLYIDYNHSIPIRTLPTDFHDEITETIPQSYDNSFTVTYVTDSDGVNYFVSASQN